MNNGVPRAFLLGSSKCIFTADIAFYGSNRQATKLIWSGCNLQLVLLRPIMRREYKVGKHAFRAMGWALPYGHVLFSLPFRMVASYRTLLLRYSYLKTSR